MRTILFLCGLLLFAGLPNSTDAAPDSFIHLNVSIKFIVDPATGHPPAGTDDANLRQTFDQMNRWLSNTWRGYRLRLVDLDANLKFKRIGVENDTTGPGLWYDRDLKNDAGFISAFEATAKAQSEFAWNTSAINIYVNGSEPNWSSAAFPWSGKALVQSGYGLISTDVAPEFYKTNNYKIAGNLLHEVGHFFGLYHTFDEDLVADNAPDILERSGRVEATVRDDLAQFTWSMIYDDLPQDWKTLVDNTANNAMSYYQLFYDDPAQAKVLTEAERFGPTRFIFTELQMDRWADYANAERLPVTSGMTRFVQWDAPAGGSGSSTAPYPTLAQGITAASSAGNDILMLRRGTYTATTLSKPMTIRGTRGGPATIRRP